MKTSHPWIIWCRQRTGSISLFAALCAASEHAPAESEPFDWVPTGERQFSDIGKRMVAADRDRSLRQICDQPWVIKHCYENLSEEFNHALAEISTRAGYRHIHLVRRNELARLVSKGVAEQYGTWFDCHTTREVFSAHLGAGKEMAPLDIAALKRYHDGCKAKWAAVGPLLRSLDVIAEDLFGHDPVATFSRAAQFLGMPRFSADTMGRNLGKGQGTRGVWKLIPNIEDLRRAIAA